ncbi:MAG: hypothetical protein WD317_04985 [Balneolaceae bacterium]
MIVIRKWMIYTAMLALLALTAPDRQAHERKIQKKYGASGADSSVVQVSLNVHPDIGYHDIHVFTFTLQNRRVLTFGALGVVFDVKSR